MFLTLHFLPTSTSFVMQTCSAFSALWDRVMWLTFISRLSAKRMQTETYKDSILLLLLKLPWKEAQNAGGWEKRVEELIHPSTLVSWVAYNSRDLFFHNSGSQKSEISVTGLKSRCWQGPHILQRLKGIYANFFQFLVATNFPWLVATSL